MQDEKILREILKKEITSGDAPGLLRLAFHETGTFCKFSGDGGFSGSITLKEEFDREENDGLEKSANKILTISKKYPDYTVADLIAIAGAVSVEVCGGPEILVDLGRKDYLGPAPTGRLPDKDDGIEILLKMFERMGLSARDFVVLSGAHTLGDAEDLPFTSDRLSFNNSYFTRLVGDKRDSNLKFFISDEAILKNDETLEMAREYAKSEDKFFIDFGIAYKKMTWLGNTNR